MTTREKRERLVALCRNDVIDDPRVVIAEPYVPFLPEVWNEVLVVAEAQNLSKTNQSYVDALRRAAPDERIERLKPDQGTNDIGIQPWDDGSLKLAVEAALGLHAEESAVSNAVLWSLRTDDEYNENPSPDLGVRSVALWTEMLKVLQPRQVVAAGAWARDVMMKAVSAANIELRPSLWILPSRRVLGPFSPMVNRDDLLRRFPEVKAVLDRHPEWEGNAYPRNKILYACLAVSAAAAR